MAHCPRVLTCERLRAELWPCGAAPSARTVDVHLTRPRAKLAGARGVHIATIRGLGYRLHLDPAA
jgi:DNA-binding response OmpR family regulator